MEPLRLALVYYTNPNDYLGGGKTKPKMYAKTCPKCGRKSYSSTWRGKWTCPYCFVDMTQEHSETIKSG